MGSTHGTITNKDNQFFWSVEGNFSATAPNGSKIFSPNFQFENESWQFVLEKITPVREPPNTARDLFLLKLTNQTRNSKSVFYVQLSVTLISNPIGICCRLKESEICKLDFRVTTAEYKFKPADIGNDFLDSYKTLAYRVAWKRPRSQWRFSCRFFKSETPYKKETLPTSGQSSGKKLHHYNRRTYDWRSAVLRSRLNYNAEDLFKASGNNSEGKLENNKEGLLEVQEKNPEWKLKCVEKLQVDLKNLLVGGKHSDVVLKVEAREFKAHRSILSARSDYFSAMFDHDTSEKQTGVVTIEDTDPDAFECLLQYIYTGEVSISPVGFVTFFCLYTVADRYQVLELKEECLKQIKSNLSVDSFCDVARMSLLYPELNLTDIISPYFRKNASDIVSTSEWETFMEENPKLCNKLLCATLKAAPKTPLHRSS